MPDVAEAILDCMGTVLDKLLPMLKNYADAVCYVLLPAESDEVLHPLQTRLVTDVISILW